MQIHDFNSTSKIDQIYRDGNIDLGVRLLENFAPGRPSTFLIDNKFYTYQNYTIVHADTNIYPLSPALAPVNARYDAIDFQALIQVFPSSIFGFEDVNSLLQIISENNIVQDQLSSLFQHSDSSSTVYLLSHVLDTTLSALKHIFLQMLSSISNPFLSFVFTVIFLLSLIWAVISTFWSIRLLAVPAISTVRKRSQPYDDSAV